MTDISNYFPTKEEIKKALESALAGGAKLERKALIDKSQTLYGYPPEALKDRSCESLNTRLKSLTGVVINEMQSAGALILNEDKTFTLPLPAEEDKKGMTKTQKRRAARKRAAAAKKNEAPKYPDSPLGGLLAAADAKFEDYKAKKLTEQNYIAALKKSVIKAISEAGGEFFEELSMKLLVAIYAGTVTKNELTAGPDDNGIDGVLTVKDPAGFSEKIFFQSKTKLNDRGYVSIKVAREFLGVMTAYGATKGILITNSNFHRDTRAFAAKRPNLLLIDSSALFSMMEETGIGLIRRDGVLRIDDALFLSCR